MFRRRPYRLMLGLLAAVLLAACGQGSGSSGGAGSGAALYSTTTIQLAVSSEGATASSLAAPFAAGAFSDVARVTIEVDGPDRYGVSQSPLASTELSQGSDGVWRGTLASLPVGPSLSFTGRAYDSAGTLLFSGVTSQSLSAGASVSIALQPVSSGVQLDFPRIVQIAVPGEIARGSQATVTAQVQGSAGEPLRYAFQPAEGGGRFDPAQGTVALPAGVTDGTVSVTYTAPQAVGSSTATLTVTNSQGNAVQSDLPLTVVYASGGGGVQVGFAPVIRSIRARRNGSAVQWWAQVSDDGSASALHYAWSFTQSAGTDGAAFTDASDNPGLLSGYDATVAGTISLRVTDGHGLSTSVSFALLAGQFPDGVVFHPPEARDDTALTHSAGPLTLNVLANDSDAGGQALTIASVSAPQHGTVTNDGDHLTYTPDAGFNGADAFTYTASNGQGRYATATVTVTVAIDVSLGRDTSLGAGTVLGDGVSLDRDVSLGDGCALGAGVQVGRDTRIGDHCAIGAGAVLDRDSRIGSALVLGQASRLGRNLTLGDSVHIGSHVSLDRDSRLGDGTVIGDATQLARNATLGDAVQLGANDTLDRDASIGDGVHIGDNASIARNVTIGAGSTLGDNVVLGRDVHIGRNVTLPDGTSLPDNASVPDGATGQ